METTLYKITFKDGGVYKVFCANRHQKDRFLKTAILLNSYQWEELENGIHTIKQWEEIINNE